MKAITFRDVSDHLLRIKLICLSHLLSYPRKILSFLQFCLNILENRLRNGAFLNLGDV